MELKFADSISEIKFRDLNEALAYVDSHPVSDTVITARDLALTFPTEVRFPGGEINSMTRSAFVQLLHFLHLNWDDVKHRNPVDVHADVQKRLRCRPGQLMFRTKAGVVQAVLSPSYTLITNADVLRSAIASLDISNAQVTFYRGQVRITGVTESVKFQPAVNDIISGGWEITNNEYGKGVLSVNQFLLRLVCTNGAVVQTGTRNERYVHRGWDRDDLMHHIGEAGSSAISRMGILNEALRTITQNRIGESGFEDLAKATATPLGRVGLENFKSEISPNSSLYDAYNHLTFVSQQKSLVPRRELELIAGSLITS